MLNVSEGQSVQRKHRRFKIRITELSKINDSACCIQNVSREGMMLTAEMDSPPFKVIIELRIRNKWVVLQGNVMWSSDIMNSRTKKMGILITAAPTAYNDFINNLYLEADEYVEYVN